MYYGSDDILVNPNSGFYLQELLDEQGITNDLFYEEEGSHEFPDTLMDEFYTKIEEYAETYFGYKPGGSIPYEVDENGFFTETFAKKLDLEQPLEYSEFAFLVIILMSDTEARDILLSMEKAGDIYESASVTFYPNGKVVINYTLTETAHRALTKSAVLTGLKRSAEEVFDYQVYADRGIIRLSDESEWTINKQDGSITREGSILALEIYSLDGEVLDPPPVDEEDPVELDYIILKDIPYDDQADDRRRMDVYVPKNLDTSKENGAFVIIYGGGWTGGSKEDVAHVAAKYATAGYVSVAVNMRNAFYDEEIELTTTTIFDMLNDVHDGVKKLKELSDEHGWNITQIATKGFSSGGNIALLYAYSRGTDMPYFNTEVVLPVRFVVNVVGPVDMHDSAWAGDENWPDRHLFHSPGAGPTYAMLITGFVNNPVWADELVEEAVNSMSPVYYVETYGAVPTISGYSARDFIQNPNNGKILKRYLDEKNVRNDLFTFPNSIHSYDNDPEEARAFFEKVIEYAETYFISTSKPKPRQPVVIITQPAVPSHELGEVRSSDRDNRKIQTLIIDSTKLYKQVEGLEQGSTIKIDLPSESDASAVVLDGPSLLALKAKALVLEIVTERGSLRLPADQLSRAVVKQIDEWVKLEDISLSIEIGKPTDEMLRVIEASALIGEFSLLVPPVEYSIKVGHDEQEHEITGFETFIERLIPIPGDVDPERIATAIVIEGDGTERHVPTQIIEANGRHAARIQSMTNSVYVLAAHKPVFRDSADHWACEAIHDLAARFIVNGTGEGLFSPDTRITRAEFAAIMVRAFGLRHEEGTGAFHDIHETDWYQRPVHTAAVYGLITGFADGTFRPEQKISREEAMVIISRAMKLTGLWDEMLIHKGDDVLSMYVDGDQVAAWSKEGVLASLQAGIIKGKNGAKLEPQAYMTRAEAVTMIQRLLLHAGLI